MPQFTTRQVQQAAADQLNVSLASLTESQAEIRLIQERHALDSPDFSRTPVVLFDIFLSHSSLDARLVLGIYAILTGRGYAIYLDSISDPHLNRRNVTRQTARTLRYRIAQSRSLTNNTTNAKWVPWELGFADGWKDGKAAVLPITDEVTFSGREFFEIYPEVQDRGGTFAKLNDLDIYDQNKYLSTWGTWAASG